MFYKTKLEGVDIQFPHQLGGMSVPYVGILCRFNNLPAGVRHPQADDVNIVRGAVVSINGTGATPEGRAQHVAALDAQDLCWKKNEIGRKCVELVDNCFTMHFSDPTRRP